MFLYIWNLKNGGYFQYAFIRLRCRIRVHFERTKRCHDSCFPTENFCKAGYFSHMQYQGEGIKICITFLILHFFKHRCSKDRGTTLIGTQ